VRLTDDYFIERARIRLPRFASAAGRDAKVNPIEEVSVQVEAETISVLQDVSLHYSRERRAEKTYPYASAKDRRRRRARPCWRWRVPILALATS